MTAAPTTTSTITLNNGVPIPQLGFGVFQVPPEQTADAVRTALETGYRSIDTAALYGNEREVGEALRSSGLRREEVFITTKVWNDQQGYDNALRAFDESLQRLGLDSVDLYLIHWPMPARDLYVETWRALEKVYADGRARAIGVSNFQADHLDRIFRECDVEPAVNQIELHPFFPQDELRALHDQRGVATEAWSPIGRGGELLKHPTVTRIAQERDVTAAQVVLRWHVQLGNIVIPRSVSPDHIRENIDVFGFELSEVDMGELSGLGTGRRIGPDPDTLNG